ncbi:MAG: hypothetical protein AAF567_00595 [Actinomycetota bacterium]
MPAVLVDDIPRQRATIAIIDAFPNGPLLEPTMIYSVVELIDRFGPVPARSASVDSAQRCFRNGGDRVLVTRVGAEPRLRSASVVIGISLLAQVDQPWDMLCLTSLDDLESADFEVVASHGAAVCNELQRDFHVSDPRWSRLTA